MVNQVSELTGKTNKCLTPITKKAYNRIQCLSRHEYFFKQTE